MLYEWMLSTEYVGYVQLNEGILEFRVDKIEEMVTLTSNEGTSFYEWTFADAGALELFQRFDVS